MYPWYDPYGYGAQIRGFDIVGALGVGGFNIGQGMAVAVPVGPPMGGGGFHPAYGGGGAPMAVAVPVGPPMGGGGYGGGGFAPAYGPAPGQYNPGLAAAYAQADAQRQGTHMYHQPGGAYGAQFSYKKPSEPMERQPMPFPEAKVVPAGGTAIVQILPQRAFRVERLVLSSDVTPSTVVVTDINVGQKPQYVSFGQVPLVAFQNTAIDTYLRGATAVPGIAVILRFLNPGAVAETINGAFLGEALEL